MTARSFPLLIIFGFVALGAFFSQPFYTHEEVVVTKIQREHMDEKIPDTYEPVSLLFVGDIMLGRNVESLIESEGGEYPFKNLTRLASALTTASGGD